MTENWSKDQTSLLILLYQKHPCLYDASDVDYLNKKKKREKLMHIVEEIRLVRSNTTINDIKHKIRTLQNQLSRERAREKRLKKCGFALDEIYKPRLWCYEQLKFLTKSANKIKRTSNIEDENNQDSLVKESKPKTLRKKLPKGRTANDEDSCYSFAGGSVYPSGTPKGDHQHQLQYTKAVISRPAPQFEGTAVIHGEFKSLNLADYLGKYVVFFFYPLDFTFVCPTEILAFSDRIEEFRKINTEVIACSVDSHFTHLAWINTPRKEGGLGKIKIPLLSDITHKISKDYGVYLDDLGHTLRGLFIIDHKGILRQITMNDLPVGRSVDETLRLVQAFQYTDTHGEVCPAGWKPGSDTIVPNPEEKKKYFAKNN